MPEICNQRVSQERLNMLSLLVFDLDGVVTSETGYWETARQAVLHLLTDSDQLGLEFADGIRDFEELIPPGIIARVKNRAVNSNWDLAFVALCLHILQVIDALAGRDAFPMELTADAPFAALKSCTRSFPSTENHLADIESLFDQLLHLQPRLNGVELLEHFRVVAETRLRGLGDVLKYRGELWELCHETCQKIEDRKRETSNGAEAVLPVEVLRQTFARLVETNRFTLAVATGRPRQEAIAPLREMGLLQYFDSQRIVTLDDVTQAEQEMATSSNVSPSFGKPHPFALRKAIEPQQSVRHLVEAPLDDYSHVAFIGDTASDVIAAQRAGVFSIGVLTGVTGGDSFRNERAAILVEAGSSLVLPDVAQLPEVLAN